MTPTTPIKGYKVTDSAGRCRGFKFEVGKEHTQSGNPKLCSNGFHFCLKPSHCFNYYDFTNTNRVFEIEAIGEIDHEENSDKMCTNKIRIVREIEWSEVLVICNEGINNTGHSNTGNRNTGDRNTGDRNTGNWNTGHWNTGNRNTGDKNTGSRNTGSRNTGSRNTGYWNTGDCNTGYWNTGNSNTGYCNAGNRNTGLFCTIDAPFPMFNKKSNWTEQDFFNSKAYSLIRDCADTKLWVSENAMTDEEKKSYPYYKTAGGYLKDIPFKEAFKNAWHNFNDDDKAAFTSLPNFSWEIFAEITGVEKGS